MTSAEKLNAFASRRTDATALRRFHDRVERRPVSPCPGRPLLFETDVSAESEAVGEIDFVDPRSKRIHRKRRRGERCPERSAIHGIARVRIYLAEA
jgi:hypothetical protein